ncbi:potassium large conductance calcium-activated channel subfamily M alpha member 1 [Paragonimus westermani]|uniref:BK channel n=1 Tax=Paragonimus westermani TaxID=34504 RepID=A0A5J4P2E7_9TREM|nr:potassium large conductance calcium-activated channel subfamily M alpha member 1 [Paragonimus westermani]
MANTTNMDFFNIGSPSKVNRLHWEACMERTGWYIFLGSSVACFLGGIAFILTYRALLQLCQRMQDACCPETIERSSFKANNHPGGKPNFHVDVIDSSFQSRRVNSPSQRSSYVNLDEPGDFHPENSIISNSYSVLAVNPPSLGTRIRNGVSAFNQFGHIFALRLVSYQWRTGRAFIALSMILSLCSFGIYAFEATVWPGEVEKCGHKGRRFRTLDFLMNVFFLIHFLVRLIAARDALVFWVDWFSIIDYLTVPPTLLGFWIRRTWLGFRFVRAFRLVNLSEVLHNLNLIKSASSLRLCHFCTMFMSIWLSGAGMLLLLENTGDILHGKPYNVTNPITYTNALYFTIVTMSTVGYGDITPQTVLGRVYISLFILIALATFASAIPVIAENFFTVRKYSGSYMKPEGKSHIVVCGEITTDSVKTFLSDFLHEDRQRSDVEVVFVNPCMPDLQLQSILRLHFSQVKYFQGTVMNHVDLQRVRMDEADACLILASSMATDPDQKDAANIMRVIAVKNYACHVRVIVQLLQTQNKAHLFNSPYWNWDAGDEIICFSELKLGFLAQSCVAPGFSTLLTNLFSMQSQRGLKEATQKYQSRQLGKLGREQGDLHLEMDRRRLTSALVQSSTDIRNSLGNQTLNPQTLHWSRKCPTFLQNMFRIREHRIKSKAQNPIIRITASSLPSPESPFDSRPTSAARNYSKMQIDDDWLVNYLRGLSMEIYSARLSPSFEGLSFAEAAVVCREKLDLLLIAVVARVPEQQRRQAYEFSRLSALGFEMDGDYEEEDEDEIYGESDQEDSKQYLAINPPSNVNVYITGDTTAFFICDSQNNASRATFYCADCHGNHPHLLPSLVKACGCRPNRSGRRSQLSPAAIRRWFTKRDVDRSTNMMEMAAETNDIVPLSGETQKRAEFSKCGTVEETGILHSDRIERRRSDPSGLKHKAASAASTLDITGMYHYCYARTFEESLIPKPTKNSSGWKHKKLVNHILVCLLTDEKKPLMGLHSFVMPLRASHYHANQLKTIVLLGNETYLRREWPSVENFPEVFCLPGSPLSRADLRSARIRWCSICVVLGSAGHAHTEDPYLLDKEVILCSLNIRGMRFAPISPAKTTGSCVPQRKFGYEIPMITELTNDANIHYLDLDDFEAGCTQIPASLTAPFARGIAFTSSVLDVLASTAYFDRNAMTLMRHLITGGVTPALEQWLAEGGMLNMHERNDKDGELESPVCNKDLRRSRYRFQSQIGLIETRQRPRIAQLSVMDVKLRPNPLNVSTAFNLFGDLFCFAIRERGILCLGVYRNSYLTKSDNDSNVPLLLKPSEYTASRVKPQNRKCSKERRLSTSAQPIYHVIRKYSHQLNRETSVTMAAEIGLSAQNADQFADYQTVLNRYVITNPPNNFRLYSSDLIFCICPFEPELC